MQDSKRWTNKSGKFSLYIGWKDSQASRREEGAA
jgi:hypothetical protein